MISVLTLDSIDPVIWLSILPPFASCLIGTENAAHACKVYRQVLIVKGQRIVAALVAEEGDPQLQPIHLRAADGRMSITEDLLL